MPKVIPSQKSHKNGFSTIKSSLDKKNDNRALVPLGSRALLPYGIQGFIATEGYLTKDENDNIAKIDQQFAWPEDLFRRYRVVQALRKELTTDRRDDSSFNQDDDDENDDEQTKILTTRFRHYLTGLFEILDQLTDMTKHLSEWYQEEIDGKQNA